MSPSKLIYSAAGKPNLDFTLQKISNNCWLCGESIKSGIDRDLVIADTFVDRDKCKNPAGKFICSGCAFCFSEKLILPEYQKPQKFRTFSHFVVMGKWYYFTKAQKDEMRRILFDPPAGEWLAVISDSGKKHLAFRAPVNYGKHGCLVQFEENRIAYEPKLLPSYCQTIETLMQAGFSKSEIETGNYNQSKILKSGLPFWKARENLIRKWRGSLSFKLALFLTQKSEHDSDEQE